MQNTQLTDSRTIKSRTRLNDPTINPDIYSTPGHNDSPPSPASSADTPVFVTTTPRSDSPSMGMGDSWVAVTPNSDDGRPRSHGTPPSHILTPELLLAVEGLRIHEHEESFPSEGEDDDEDISIPPSEDSSVEDDEDEDLVESSDEETILAPRTLPSLGNPISDDALRASLSTLLKSKDASSALMDDMSSPRRSTGPMGIESLSLVNPEEFATRASMTTSRASSAKSHSRAGKKSRGKRSPRSQSKSRSKDNAAQIYALWTAAITAGFLVGFGAGYAWKEYIAGGGGEDVRRVGCTWCGDTKR